MTEREMEEMLRSVIRDSGKTQKEIELGSGVDQSTISKFMSHHTSLYFPIAAKLMVYFGIEMVMPKR